MSKEKPWEYSLESLVALFRSRELSPLDYTEALLSRVTTEDKKYCSFITVTNDIALAEAEQATREIRAGRWRGPLHGIPYGLKDIIDYAGVPTTAQSSVLRGYRAERDAGVTRKLKAQGAVLLGKLATDEFACGGHPTDSAWPVPRNPWNANYITAGSSSGSAVAVAARLLPLSLGTDTAGSVRNPAARCGLVGMKPTYGRVSRAGVVPLAPSMDHVGPLTRTVTDNAIALGAIAGEDADDPLTYGRTHFEHACFSRDLKGLRVAVARNVYQERPHADPEHAAGIETLVAVLQDAGAEIHEVRIDALDKYNSLSRLLLSVEAYAVHERWLRAMPERYGARCLSRLVQGAFITGADYARLLQLRQRYTREIEGLLTNADLLVTASGYDATPRVDDREAFMRTYACQVRMPFNMTGHPALVLPTGFSKVNGMPLSAQIVGNYFTEAMIYRAARVYERINPWHERSPLS